MTWTVYNLTEFYNIAYVSEYFKLSCQCTDVCVTANDNHNLQATDMADET
jgi:hypothetical protein